MKTITQQRLIEVLQNITHATPIGFVALTIADAKVNPLGVIRKLTKVNALTGCQFETSVNRSLVRQGDAPTFVAQDRTNQTERLGPCLARKTVDGEERFYLPVQVQHARDPLYLVSRPRGLGRFILTVVSKEQVAPYLSVPRKPPQNGAVKKIVYRDYALDSITQIAIDGRRYRVRG